MTNLLWIIWLIVGLAMVIVEILTVGILAIWFALGAFAAMILAYLGFSLVIQLSAFLVVSLVALLIGTKFVTTKLKVEGTPESMTVIGKEGKVTKKISPHTFGEVFIKNEYWAARSVDNEPIEVGAIVEVVDTQGVHVIVKRK
jgi:membrane protein implicated in regulation of membrane protease activity